MSDELVHSYASYSTFPLWARKEIQKSGFDIQTQDYPFRVQSKAFPVAISFLQPRPTAVIRQECKNRTNILLILSRIFSIFFFSVTCTSHPHTFPQHKHQPVWFSRVQAQAKRQEGRSLFMTPEISCTCLGNGLLCLGNCQIISPAASQLSRELSRPTDLQMHNPRR